MSSFGEVASKNFDIFTKSVSAAATSVASTASSSISAATSSTSTVTGNATNSKERINENVSSYYHIWTLSSHAINITFFAQLFTVTIYDHLGYRVENKSKVRRRCNFIYGLKSLQIMIFL